MDYELNDRDSRVGFLAGTGNFSLHHCVQNGPGAHPASYPMATMGSFPEVKWLGRESDHLPLSSAEVNNAWGMPPLPQYAFVEWCSVRKESTGTTLHIPLPVTRQLMVP